MAGFYWVYAEFYPVVVGVWSFLESAVKVSYFVGKVYICSSKPWNVLQRLPMTLSSCP